MQRFVNSFSLGSQMYVSFRVTTENDQNILEIVGTSGTQTANVVMRISESDLSKLWFRLSSCEVNQTWDLACIEVANAFYDIHGPHGDRMIHAENIDMFLKPEYDF